ncbi:MAG: ParA family protein [Myxococcota bacterium]|nr:ParA family protein [Myxococcota bacterium]
MRVISFWTGKGGSGKTTCAVQLAAALAECGWRVLVVDLDPSAGSTLLLGELPEPGLLDAMRGDLPLGEIAVPTGVAGVSLVPAGPDLARAEALLRTGPDRTERVAIAIDSLRDRGDDWDFVLLDCAAGAGLLALGTLVAAHEHVAVIDPRPLSVLGLGDTVALADLARERLNPDLAVSRVLLSRVPRGTASRTTRSHLRVRHGDRVLRSEIPECAGLVEASWKREPVIDFAPEAPSARAFRALAVEFAPESRREALAERARLAHWLATHPGVAHGRPHELLDRCENSLRRHASEDAWRRARSLLRDPNLHWGAGAASSEGDALGLERLCHELATELERLEPRVCEGCEERLVDAISLDAFEPEAQEAVRAWVRALAPECEHRAWARVVSFTDARGRNIDRACRANPAAEASDGAAAVAQILAHDFEEHALRAHEPTRTHA